MADNLHEEMERVLTIYSEDINEKLREITKESMKKLVKETKATAPRGRREGKDTYRRHITADYTGTKRSSRGLKGQDVNAVWYVKAPDYRLTHLLVKGHATRNGGRTRANPFLHNAVEKVIPEYEAKVEEALKDGN